MIEEKQFGSVGDYVAYGQSPCRMNNAERSSVTNPSYGEWDCGVGYQGAVKLALSGWPEGTARMRKLADQMYAVVAPKVTVWQEARHAVSGAMVDVGAYVAGEPECMLDFSQSEVRTPRPVDIVVAASASCNVPAERLCNRGAAILAAIEALEQANCSVGLTVDHTVTRWNRDGETRLTHLVRVKQPGQPLDPDALAFAVMHPAFLRRISFAAMEHAPYGLRREIGIRPTGGYGTPADAPAAGQPQVRFYSIQQGQGYESEEAALKSVLQVIRQAGLLDEAERR